MSTNEFQEVYPFTNEMLSSYLPKLKLKNKKILTVGSSGDQAFNALLLGAKDITVLDISPYSKEFIKIKKDLILRYERQYIYHKVLAIDDVPILYDDGSKLDAENRNLYLQNNQNYTLLQDKLKHNNIKVIEGDIFKMTDTIGTEKYDCIILSNVLLHLSLFISKEKQFDFIFDQFQEWKNHLNKNGILQLYYTFYYNLHQKQQTSKIAIENYKKIEEMLENENDKLKYMKFLNIDGKNYDAVTTYTKKKGK